MCIRDRKRPPARNHCRSKVGKLVWLRTVAERPSTEEPVDPSALNSTIECAQMTRAETSGVREGSSAGPVPVIHNDGRLGIGTVSLAVP